jgi:hypothetical protein
MADLATAFHDRVLADGAVSADLGTQLYGGVVGQKAVLPYARYHIISDPRPEHLKGYQGSRRTRIQVSIFAESFNDAKRIGSNIVKALDAPWSTSAGKVGRVKCEGPREGQGTDTPNGFIHHQIVEAMMEHTFQD